MKLTEKNYRSILSYKKDPEDMRDYPFNSSRVSVNRNESSLMLPGAIDYTTRMSRVRDQGNLGSCVGFAVAAMKEWQEATEHALEVKQGKRDHRKGKEYDLSEAWVYWNCKKIDPWPNEEGTSIRFAMKVLNKIGVPCEGAWKYSDVNPGKPESWASLVSQWSLIKSYWRVKSLDDLKVALMSGPVVIGIPCFDTIFYAGSSGLIEYPRDPNAIYGGHALCAVGFSDKTYGGVIKVKNSWGKYWGNSGYGFLPYQYINDFLWDAWACQDLSVTREMLTERNL
jgi:C1A family cysteine protease